MTRYIDAIKWKARALKNLVQIRGRKEKDLWRQKRPDKFFQQAEDRIKLKVSLLDNPPDDFPNLRHPAGCSLQFVIMCAYLLGEEGEDAWFRQYINPYQEGIVESPYDIQALLNKVRKTIQNA